MGRLSRKENIYSVWFKVKCAPSLNLKLCFPFTCDMCFEAVVLEVCCWFRLGEGTPSGGLVER